VTSRRIDERLQQHLDDHIAARRPLPGYQGKVNTGRLAATLECHRREIVKRRQAIDAVAAVVGVADAAFIDEAIQGTLDGRPWVKAITTHHTLPTSLAALARHLQTACYIVTAFLSGMRDSEVKHIKRGCVEVKRDEDGNACRWRVHSRAFKGEEDAEGVEATWTVCEPVVRAIRVLEQLQPASQDYLMGALLHSSGQAKGAGVDRAVGVGATNQNLNLFAGFINELCTELGRTDTIAAGNGHAFRLKTRVFRRTLAWFIARHPGGVIAGALQYRHQSIQMFEGYAGTSDSGFRAEVESEQAIARGEIYMEMIDSHQHAGLAGPSAEEAARRLTDFGERVQFQGQVTLDRHRLKRIMKRHDPAIYPGEYITCVNDPAKALCEKARRGNSEGLPSHGGCLPLVCRNVALTPENVAAWQRELARIDKRLGSRPTLTPRLRQLLQGRRAEIAEFLTASGQEAVPA
jgi:integrase